MTCDFQAKLSDFGFSLEAPLLQNGKTIFTCPLVAFTQGYCAPEVMEGHCSTKSYVYSYGVVSGMHIIKSNIRLTLNYNKIVNT